MRLLLDEMYPPALADALGAIGIDATLVRELNLTGASDPEIFAAALAGGWAILTENLGDFTAPAAEHGMSGGHHAGVLIALSSRFSRRPAGVRPLVTAIGLAADDDVADRVVFLRRPHGF